MIGVRLAAAGALRGVLGGAIAFAGVLASEPGGGGPGSGSFVSTAYAQSSYYPSQGLNRRQGVCQRLELQLQQESVLAQSGRSRIPQLRQQRSSIRLALRRWENQADRLGCYQQFFFSTTLRQTRRCIRVDRQVRRARAQLRNVEGQIQRSGRSGRPGANRRNRIIALLARNRCGVAYQRAASRQRRRRGWNPFESVFGDGFGGGFFDNAPRDLPPEDGIQIGSTYRTMCVRQCDGYYFPVSFSTLPSRFPKDANVCTARCAAPASLYVYRNPGAEVEQMVSLDGQPYTKLENAFRYRKEFVQGCSCKLAEFDPNAGTAAARSARGQTSASGVVRVPGGAAGVGGTAAAPRAGASETGASETGVPEIGVPEIGVPEIGVPGAESSEGDETYGNRPVPPRPDEAPVDDDERQVYGPLPGAAQDGTTQARAASQRIVPEPRSPGLSSRTGLGVLRSTLPPPS